MKAKIFDTNNRWIQTLTGTYSNGMFYYKESKFTGDKDIPILPDDCYYEPYGLQKTMERTVEYTWDGKNYVQRHVRRNLMLYEKQIVKVDGKETIDYKPIQSAIEDKDALGIADYISTNTIADLQKDKTMQKPVSWKDVAKFLEIFLLIALVIATYYALVGDYHLSNSTVAVLAFNKTANLAYKVCTTDLNKTAFQLQIDNATLTQLRRLSG